MGKKRQVQEINASSMADIAFLLLIFFLVTTSMATDKGLLRVLPAPVPKDQKVPDEAVKVKERNILQILVNSNNDLMVNGQPMEISKLKEKAKEFIENPNNDENLPEKEWINVEHIGNRAVTTSHVISLLNDRGTSYQVYLKVQNELVAAYNELREDLAQKKFGTTMEELAKEKQAEKEKLGDAAKKSRYDAIAKDIYPMKISEAEPKNYGGSK